MLEKNAFDRVSDALKPEFFYQSSNELIYRAMENLALKSSPIDIVTVVEQLRLNGTLTDVGGPFYVAGLTNKVSSSAHLEAHSEILMKKWIQRQLGQICIEIASESYDDSVDIYQLLDEAEEKIFDLTNIRASKDFEHIGKSIIQNLKRIDVLRKNDNHLTGIPTGFYTLDRVTHGWQPTDLIIIAARPSVGKTAFALNLARSAAINSVPVAIFSLEMSTQQLNERIMSSESGVYLEKIKTGKLNDHEYAQVMNSSQSIASYPIYIDDTASLGMLEFRAKARRLRHKFQVGLIIIDYLQLMSGDNKVGNREQEISKISRDLKKVAKDLNIPIIALSQMSREVEKRNGTPRLSDLRDSGSIEQDADIVMFLYRPSEEDQKRDIELRNTGYVKISKHRNGSLEEIIMEVDLSIQKWKDIGDQNFRTPERLFVDYTVPSREDIDDDLPF